MSSALLVVGDVAGAFPCLQGRGGVDTHILVAAFPVVSLADGGWSCWVPHHHHHLHQPIFLASLTRILPSSFSSCPSSILPSLGHVMWCRSLPRRQLCWRWAELLCSHPWPFFPTAFVLVAVVTLSEGRVAAIWSKKVLRCKMFSWKHCLACFWRWCNVA